MSNTITKRRSDLNSRFIEVMERLGHSGYSFSRELGTSEAVISNIRNGKNPPNINLVERMLHKYEEVDPDWLLAGRGRMFRREAGATALVNGGVGKELLPAMNERLIRLEKLMEKALAGQLERNILTDESVSDLERQVVVLEGELRELKKDRHKGK